MNIKQCYTENTDTREPVKCPRCHFNHIRKHGAYSRKGFHVIKQNHTIPMVISRYRCLNPNCSVCTFSVLPLCVLRYCRFFYPELLQVKNALSIGIPPSRLARFVWNVGKGVIDRIAAELSRMSTWITQTFREVSNGAPEKGFRATVTFLSHSLGCSDLTERYGYHRYPHRLIGAK